METGRRQMGLGQVRSIAIVCGFALGCGAAPAGRAPAPVAVAMPAEAPRAPDPDLHRPPPRKLLDIDWQAVALATDADALAVWRRIAPTGADWEDKLEEIPAAAARPLARAVIRGGDFACAPPPATAACVKPAYDVPAPSAGAGFDDPCLRRMLGLWALAQVEDDDAASVLPALRAIAALPPPESQLVVAALHAVPEAAQDDRLALIALAWSAGQREVVESVIGKLDDAHLVDAVRKHHIASALELLAVADHRAVYLAAIADEDLASKARLAAITELSASLDLGKDARAALVAATKAKDCQVAAAAARALDQAGDHRFVPKRPATTSPPALMRAMCVLASYEAMQRSDEASQLASFLPARGLERITITYDALSETDPDGDGDPHTTHAAELVPRAEAVLPEVEDLVRAMQHCAGTICVSDDHEFRFVWTAGQLTRLEVADRPPCTP